MIFGRKGKRRSKMKRAAALPLPVLIRQVVYDSMLEPAEEIANALGLPPISEEVAEMEERASQDRLEEFSNLLPFIDSHSDIISKIAAAAYILSDEIDTEEKLNNIDLEDLTKLFRLVSLSASVSCLSTLFNLGLLQKEEVHNG
jgi:hypothetical protein